MSLAHPAYGQLRPVTATAAVLLAANPSPMTLAGTNTWILRVPGHAQCVVVDPGPDEQHSAALAQATGEAVAVTLLTHHHHDHTAGVDRLVERTGTTVRSVDPGWLRGTTAALTDGEVIEAAGLRITAVLTPGHTPDSVSFLLADAMLTGDTIVGSGTTVLDSYATALGDYLASLQRLAELAAERALLPGHGPDQPDAAAVIAYYRQHRQQRLAQVRQALQQLGPDATARQVVEHVYTDVDRRVWPAAESSVQAQLAYLREHP